MIKFGNCSLAEFTALCDQRGIKGIERDFWIKLFKRCAKATGKKKVIERHRRIVSVFIARGQKLREPSTPIVPPKPKRMLKRTK